MLVALELLPNQFLQNWQNDEEVKLNNLSAYTKQIKKYFEGNQTIYLLGSDQERQRVIQSRLTGKPLKIDRKTEKLIANSNGNFIENSRLSMKIEQVLQLAQKQRFWNKIGFPQQQKSKQPIRAKTLSRD